MARFIHHPDGWITIDGSQMRLDAFLELEPAYALPAKAIGRRDEVVFSADSQWLDPDFDPAPYVLRAAEYKVRSDALDAGPPPTLAEVKTGAAAAVDAATETARRQWITTGSGQVLVYEAKRSEAEAWAAAGSPRALADYPFMRARAARLKGVPAADATEAQMQAVAAEWLAKAALWRGAGIAIEDLREQAKEDIDAAVDAAAVLAVLAGLAWPAPA